MSFPRIALISGCAFSLVAFPSFGQSGKKSKPAILEGPSKANIETYAQIDVPEGYSFMDGKTTRAMMKASGEPVSGQEVGFLQPTNEDFSVFFEFSSIGYVKDDDKDKLDPDKLLAAIKKG